MSPYAQYTLLNMLSHQILTSVQGRKKPGQKRKLSPDMQKGFVKRHTFGQGSNETMDDCWP